MSRQFNDDMDDAHIAFAQVTSYGIMAAPEGQCSAIKIIG